MYRGLFAALLMLPLGCMLAMPARAQQTDFFKGKLITFYIGFAPGGSYDAYPRLLSRFMGKYIPGNPTIQPKQMVGGGGRVATNYVYNVAPKDGTALGTGDQSLALEQIIGDSTVLFDATKLIWLGNPDSDNNVVITWVTSGVKTIEEARHKEVSIGSTGYNTSSQYVQAMNTIAGTKFKIVLGYPGGNDVNLAMERGEMGGSGSSAWSFVRGRHPEWLSEHKASILVQIGLKKAADLPDVPLLLELAQNDTDRQALELLSAPPTIGRPFFTSPGVAADRVAILRSAFDSAMKDFELLQAAKTEQLDINPVSGVDLQKIVEEIVSTPKPVARRLAEIITLPGQTASEKKQ